MRKNLVLTLAGITLLSSSALAETKKYDNEISKLQKQIEALRKDVEASKKANENHTFQSPVNSDLLKVGISLKLDASKHFQDKTGRGFGSALQAAQVKFSGKLSPEWHYRMKVDFASENFGSSSGAKIYDNSGAFGTFITKLRGLDPALYQILANNGMKLTSDNNGVNLSSLSIINVKRTTEVKDARIMFFGFYPVSIVVGRFTPVLNPDHDDQFLELPALAAVVPVVKDQLFISYNNDKFFAMTSVASSAVTSTTDQKDIKKVWYSRVSYAPIVNNDDVVLLGVSSAIAKTNPNSYIANFNQRPENSLGSILVGTGTLTNSSGSRTYLADFSIRKSAFSLQSSYALTRLKRNSGLANSKFRGAYLQLAYSLTGEVRGYDPALPGFSAIKPAHSFDLANGKLGAFEAKYRYSFVNFGKTEYSQLGGVNIQQANNNGYNDPLNYPSLLVSAITGVTPNANGNFMLNGGKMTINTLGFNWYPTENLTFMLDYSFVNIKNSQIWGAIYKARDNQVNGMPAANQKPKIITLRANINI